ncbi:hypothetical protein JYU15_02175 [bacterium AH-315-I18]|nr:hypothetical protein [bacterium AH-315-I18]
MNNINHDSPSVLSYLVTLQGVISRMSANSASCKTWCITLVSAILVAVADKKLPDYVWIALIPTLLFFFLDAYYLGLEKGFRSRYNNYIEKLHANSATLQDTFVVSLECGQRCVLCLFVTGLRSVSVWPFYFVLLSLIVFVHQYFQ